LDCALGTYRYFGGDDVLLPVAGAGGDVAGQREIRLVDMAMLWARPTPDSSMPPHQTGWNFGAEIVDAFGLQVAADAAEFDVDDFAGTEGDGGFGLFVGVDALVEQMGVCKFFWMATWPKRSSQPRGCSIIMR